MANYVDWIRKYNNFSFAVTQVQSKINSDFFQKSDLNSMKDFYNLAKSLFVKTQELLKAYLEYNGVFQKNDLLVFRYAYYSEILEDGQKWMNLFFCFNSNKKISLEDKYKYITMLFKNDYIKIFEKLIIYFEKQKEFLEE